MRPSRLLLIALVLALAVPLTAGATTLAPIAPPSADDATALLGQTDDSGVTYVRDGEVTKTDNVELKKHIPYVGGSEVDSDGERYLFAAEANLNNSLGRQNVTQGTGGLHIVDLVGEKDPVTGEWIVEPYTEVGFLDCPGTDNYVRYLDPDVYNVEGEGEFVVISFHGNKCVRRGEAWSLQNDPNTQNGYGAQNGIMVVDVSDKTDPKIVSVIGHESAHTVMPHPTRPYFYILPGGLSYANGGNINRQRIAPTGIIDASDLLNLEYVRAFDHNQSGCHDLGFTHDGNYAYCAGIQEVQVWRIDGDRIENPLPTGKIANPAIMFAHNVVVSPSGKYIAINDEAFGFHTCTGEAADLYGSLWIYDITVPDAPVLAGRITPPGHPNGQTQVGAYTGWAQSWCAAHNYNWLPGTDDLIAASWFSGGVTVHDMSNPLLPELVAHYMPDDGTAWSGHFYAGHLVSNDMARGLEILTVDGLPEPDGDVEQVEYLTGPQASALSMPRVDHSDLLIPDVLPERPAVKRDVLGSGICVLPSGRL